MFQAQAGSCQYIETTKVTMLRLEKKKKRKKKVVLGHRDFGTLSKRIWVIEISEHSQKGFESLRFRTLSKRIWVIDSEHSQTGFGS